MGLFSKTKTSNLRDALGKVGDVPAETNADAVKRFKKEHKQTQESCPQCLANRYDNLTSGGSNHGDRAPDSGQTATDIGRTSVFPTGQKGR